MKKSIIIIVIILVVALGLSNRTLLSEKADAFLYQSPCDTPKTFRIGTIDSRFGITQSELITDAREAANVWKNEAGMPLLQYDANASMPINMLYDQRQALNSQISNLDNQTSQQKNELKPEIALYEQQAADFKKKSDDLNAQIQEWNSKGGAPEDVYNKLKAQQDALQQQADQLQQKASQLNQSTDQYNQQVQQLNQKVDTFNNALQYKPEEGEYSRDGADEKIDIYFDNSRQELIHTLAHEMGHAIGLGHNNNIHSIMYPRTNMVVIPSADDISALAEVCKKRSVFVLLGENIITAIEAFKQNIDAKIVQFQ
jgi:peptidoglycan hydrolase CwlO-like protein